MNLSVEDIIAASQGDKAALERVLQFYDPYISHFSLEEILDSIEGGQRVIDNDTKSQLQCKLLEAIRKFDIKRALSNNDETHTE